MDDKEQFSLHFREVQPKFTRLCVQQLEHARLTMPQFAVLNLLNTSGSVPMTELSEKLYISKPAVTNLVDRLEKNKYLKRVEHDEDRRISLIEILPRGRKVVHKMQSAILQFLLKTLGQFNASEKETITRFYALLSQTMDEFLNKGKEL